MRILLAEDDAQLGRGIQINLGEQRYTIDWVTDGMAAKQAILGESFDVIILDLGLPKLSGLELLRHIRKVGVTTPVLILTARDSLEDRIIGLDAGADDYLVKPFDFEEVLARVRALHRRHCGIVINEIIRGDLVLNPASHRVTKAGEKFDMPRREFVLLQKLLENQGRIVERDVLLQTLYGWEDEIDSNALEVHIHNIRKKFGTDLIRTVRGVGYMIEKTEESESQAP